MLSEEMQKAVIPDLRFLLTTQRPVLPYRSFQLDTLQPPRFLTRTDPERNEEIHKGGAKQRHSQEFTQLASPTTMQLRFTIKQKPA
jgi:hypothetical protein